MEKNKSAIIIGLFLIIFCKVEMNLVKLLDIGFFKFIEKKKIVCNSSICKKKVLEFVAILFII